MAHLLERVGLELLEAEDVEDADDVRPLRAAAHVVDLLDHQVEEKGVDRLCERVARLHHHRLRFRWERNESGGEGGWCLDGAVSRVERLNGVWTHHREREATARANESPAARLRGQRVGVGLACLRRGLDRERHLGRLADDGDDLARDRRAERLLVAAEALGSELEGLLGLDDRHLPREGTRRDRRNGTSAARIPARRGGGKEGTCGEMACDGKGGVACGCGIRIRVSSHLVVDLGLAHEDDVAEEHHRARDPPHVRHLGVADLRRGQGERGVYHVSEGEMPGGKEVYLFAEGASVCVSARVWAASRALKALRPRLTAANSSASLPLEMVATRRGPSSCTCL